MDELYPGESVRIRLLVSNEGIDALYFVEPTPGLEGRLRRLRWRLVGRFFESPTAIAISGHKHWEDPDRMVH